MKVAVDINSILSLPDRLKNASKEGKEIEQAIKKLVTANKTVPPDLMKRYEQSLEKVQSLKDQVTEKKQEKKQDLRDKRAEEKALTSHQSFGVKGKLDDLMKDAVAGGLEKVFGKKIMQPAAGTKLGKVGNAVNKVGAVVDALGEVNDMAREAGETEKRFREANPTERAIMTGEGIQKIGGMIPGPLGIGINLAGKALGASAERYQTAHGRELGEDREMRLNDMYGRFVSDKDRMDYRLRQSGLKGRDNYEKELAGGLGLHGSNAALQGMREHERFVLQFHEGSAYDKLRYMTGIKDEAIESKINGEIAKKMGQAKAGMQAAADVRDYYAYQEQSKNMKREFPQIEWRSAEDEFSMLESTDFARRNYARGQCSRAKSRSGD
jgi:hypothetical protein